MERKTRISFKEINDGLAYEICLNGMYIGEVKVDLWTSKWKVIPSFSLPREFSSIKKDKFDSSYKAGKEMAKLYDFLFPLPDEYNMNKIFNFDDVVFFLKNLEEFDDRIGLLLKLVEEEKITTEDCFGRVKSLFVEFKKSFKGLK